MISKAIFQLNYRIQVKVIKQLKHRIFIKIINLESLFSARAKVLNNFKSRLFPIKNFDKV